MRRSTHLMIVLFAVVALLVVGMQASVSSPATAATQAATKAVTKAATAKATTQPTKAATAKATKAATQVATEAATEPASEGDATEVATMEATDESSNTPITFTKAPAPDAGTVGISVLADDNPVTLSSVLPDGPADKAGLQPGDEIAAVNGKAVKTRKDLIDQIVASKPGSTITFTINRDGKKQDIKVSVDTRRKVYCPLPDPALSAGNALVKDPLNAAKNWAFDSQSTKGVKLVVENNKLSFTTTKPEAEWIGLATLHGKPAPEFALSVDVTQTGASVAGILFNYNASSGDYSLQLLPNGSWSLSAIVDGQSAAGGLSFYEPDLLKGTEDTSPAGQVTNTIGITVQADNLYLYFNGKFACGTSLVNFSDPPLDPGSIGLFAIVAKDPTATMGVVYSNLTFDEIKK